MHVGDRVRLTAVFSGTEGKVEGIGAIESGVPLSTPVLVSRTQFTLKVRENGKEAQATLVVDVSYQDRIRRVADSPIARSGHLAVALADGSALVMGGASSESSATPDSATTQRFDPSSETLLPGPALVFPVRARLSAVAVPLRAGFLLAGAGVNTFAQGTPSELVSQTFDPVLDSFTRAGDLTLRHEGTGIPATLADGRVLLTGGGTPGTRATEIYDPGTRSWTRASEMVLGRRSHSATLLKDGRVLIAGGVVCCVPSADGASTTETWTASAELYDPRTDTFRPTGSLGVARGFHQATLLADGRVLVTGGDGGAGIVDPAEILAGTEVYDPVTETFTPGAALSVPRAFHSAVLLADGRVLVVGGIRALARSDDGIRETELFDPRSGHVTPGPMLDPAWFNVTATLLGNGKVLLFGGETALGDPQASVLLYE